VPQKPVLFARKSSAIAPDGSRGFFIAVMLKDRQRGVVRENLRVRVRYGSIAAAVMVIAFTASAHAQSVAANVEAPAAGHEVVDEAGRTVRIPQPVQRIVSLAPSLTETIYALGLQDRLVGDTDYCDYPEDAQKKTKVGGAINPNLEEIAALRPDLVLMTKSLNRLDTVHALESLGIPAYATDPHTVGDIVSSTKRLSDVLGAPEAGVALGLDLERRLEALKQRLAPFPRRRVFFIVWPEPLISIGKDTFIADALRWAGAVSIVDSAQGWPEVNLEEVVKLQPDYLVVATGHGENLAHDIETFSNLPGWRLLEAVRNRRVAVISDAVNRPAPRIISAIEELARQLHPEAFAEPHEKEKIEKENPPKSGYRSVAASNQEEEDGMPFEEACACAR
jgi:cobalamin transport system substrate-binding protein